jgi:tetrapyrrole methylase family protein/MazG family protein
MSASEPRRGATFPELVAIMERLRAPGGCPWDREQTHETLKAYLVEEAYEVLEAIDAADDAALCEELGDLLLQVVFHAELGREGGRFTIDDVVRAISDKLVRRHPHVFGDAEAEDADAVLRNWAKLKAAERREKGVAEPSALDGVPQHLPALLRAQRLGDKAASVGFDWSAAEAVLEKVEEEIRELRAALADPAGRHAEVGDLLFAVAQLSRHLAMDAEDALRAACRRFTERFQHVEAALRGRGAEAAHTPMEELERLWQEAKKARG